MSDRTTGRQMLRDLEKRVAELERQLGSFIASQTRQRLDAEHLVSKSPSDG